MPDLDLDDFFAGALDTFRNDAGLFGLPLQIESSLLFYRADLFEAAGLEGPPETMDELMDVRRRARQRRGRRLRHARPRRRRDQPDRQPALLVRRRVAGRGGQVRPGLPESIAAHEFYAELMRNYGPPGPANLHWAEVTSLYAQGQAR
jgi:multiple sugar transport system substrate-binding protein